MTKKITIPSLNYKELYEPYTRDGNTLENTIRYLRKEAETRGIEFSIVDLAMQEIFMEVHNGKNYLDIVCPCGCESTKAGTAITHAMRSKMFELDEALQTEIAKICENTANLRISTYVKRQKAWQKQEKKRLKQEKKARKKRK